MEDYAYVLDVLPQGHPERSRHWREPLAYALGELEFKLFELVPKEGATLAVGDRVYVGKEPALRDVIVHVRRRVGFDELTNAAQSEVPYVIEKMVKAQEARFVKFFNEAQPITTRFHVLELLPGMGKKTMWAMIEERKRGPFASFDDIGKRVAGVRHPEKLVAKRIELELADLNQKYRIFAAR